MIRETRTAAASGWFMFWQQQTNVIFTLLQRRQPHAVMASLRRSHLPHPKEKECRRHDIVLKLTAKCFINNNQDGTAIIGGSASVVGTPLTLSMLHTNNGAEKRKSMGYVDKSPVPESSCGNCGLYIPFSEKSPCGKCLLFKGPVLAEGHCLQWVAKTQAG